MTALATASAAPIAITQRNPDTKDSSIARRISCCVPESAHFKDVVLDTAERQRILNPNTSRLASYPRKDASMSDSNCRSRSDLVAPLCFSMVTRDAAHGRSNTIHRITRFGRTGARFLPAQWNIGAEDCVASPQPPLQVQTYEPQTFILRQSPCATFEANFLYLLIGSDKALLIDTGAVADPKAMPLRKRSWNCCRTRTTKSFHFWWHIPTGIWIIALAMLSSHLFHRFRSCR